MIRLFGVLMFVCCIGITLFADDVSNSDTVSPQKLVPDIPDASETVQPAKGINPELLELIQKIAQDGYRLPKTVIPSNIPDSSNNKVIDISSEAGLKLDDALSALALEEVAALEQAAAQLLVAENKAQKQVSGITSPSLAPFEGDEDPK